MFLFHVSLYLAALLSATHATPFGVSTNIKAAIGKISRSPDLQTWCKTFIVQEVGYQTTVSRTSAWGTKTKDAITNTQTTLITGTETTTSTLPTLTSSLTSTVSETSFVTQSTTTTSFGPTLTTTTSYTPTSTVTVVSSITETSLTTSYTPTTTTAVTVPTTGTILSWTTLAGRQKRSIALNERQGAAVHVRTVTLSFSRPTPTPEKRALEKRCIVVPPPLQPYTYETVLNGCIHVVGLPQTTTEFITGPSTTKTVFTATVSATTTQSATSTATVNFTPILSTTVISTSVVPETSTASATSTVYTETDVTTTFLPTSAPAFETSSTTITDVSTSYETSTEITPTFITCYVDPTIPATCLPVQTLQSLCLGNLALASTPILLMTGVGDYPASFVYVPSQQALYNPQFNSCLMPVHYGNLGTDQYQLILQPCGEWPEEFAWSLNAVSGLLTFLGAGSVPAAGGTSTFVLPDTTNSILLDANTANCGLGFNLP